MSRHYSSMTMQDIFLLLRLLHPGKISYPRLAMQLHTIEPRILGPDPKDGQTIMRWTKGSTKSSYSADLLAPAVQKLLQNWAADPQKFPSSHQFVQAVRNTLLDPEIQIREDGLSYDPAELIHQLVTAAFDMTVPTPTIKEESPAALPSSAVVTEGAVLTDVHPAFIPRLTHEKDLFFPYYAKLRVDGQHFSIPYKELFGSGRQDVQEYIEGKNLFMLYEDYSVDFTKHLPLRMLSEDLETERQQAARLGYTEHPAKLCLLYQLEHKDSQRLHMTFGETGYLEHRLYFKNLLEDTQAQEDYARVLAQPRGNNAYLNRCPWALCGGGTWVITSDHFLLLSYRTNVSEEKGKLSYSASCSFNRYADPSSVNKKRKDNSPASAMSEEIMEELGLPSPNKESLRLISQGIDIPRCVVQFSYVWHCPYTAEDVRYYRQNEALTADEHVLCFIPFDRPDLCEKLLLQCEFEPGAAASLKRLLEKEFGI